MDAKLHALFRPMQANGRDPAYTYSEWPPSPALKPYVACYWASEPARLQAALLQKGGSAVDRVLPDGCTDLLFEQDLVQGSYQLRYCGIFDQSFTISYDEHRPVRKFGVRFFPGGAPVFFKLQASSFMNQQAPLDALWSGPAGELGERLNEASSAARRAELMDGWLLSMLDSGAVTVQPGDTLKNGLYRIFITAGNVSVRELAETEGISTRQLNRKFDQWIGMGPKRFSEIVRFQAVLRDIRQHPGTDGMTIALAQGFFDQAHFIREFRRFYGETPGKAQAEYRIMSDLYKPGTV